MWTHRYHNPSSLTIGEIQKGISKLPVSKKKSKLQNWLGQSLFKRFDRKIIAIDYIVAQKWGEILSTSEKKGYRLPAIDSLIAATAIVNNMTLVTWNTSDMVRKIKIKWISKTCSISYSTRIRDALVNITINPRFGNKSKLFNYLLSYAYIPKGSSSYEKEQNVSRPF